MKDHNMDKKQLRLNLKRRLNQMSDEQRIAKSKKILNSLLATPEFKTASTILIYLSLPEEVDSTEIILRAWQQSKVVSVPKIDWNQVKMIPVTLNSITTGFSTEVMGLRNPVEGVPVPLQEIDLVLMPGLGFDKKGNRLGRGGGYYDRFCANPDLNASKCGLAFSEQLVDNIPVTERDQALDLLVTDNEVIYFNKKRI